MTVNLTDSTYGAFGDFHLDTFAVESYSDAMAYGSLLAHGTIGNVLITVPPPPVTNLQILLSNRLSQIQFGSRSNWNYVLQTSSNLQAWLPAGAPVSGTNGGGGTVFRINTDGLEYTNLYSFQRQGGANTPGANLYDFAGLLVSGNTIYGTASVSGIGGQGTLFQINTDGTAFSVLHSFQYTDGGQPEAVEVAVVVRHGEPRERQ